MRGCKAALGNLQEWQYKLLGVENYTRLKNDTAFVANFRRRQKQAKDQQLRYLILPHRILCFIPENQPNLLSLPKNSPFACFGSFSSDAFLSLSCAFSPLGQCSLHLNFNTVGILLIRGTTTRVVNYLI